MMKKNKAQVFLAKLLSAILIISIAVGYGYLSVSVQAQQDIVMENNNSEKAVATEKTLEKTTNPDDVVGTGQTLEETTNPEDIVGTGQTSGETINPEDYTLVAHRGYSGYAPENSMPAFEKAVASGFTTIELDIRRCKEDSNGTAVWVVSHNDSLKNTMGVDENISELTYSQILKYSYTQGNGIEAYKDLKIVSLEEIIDLIRQCKEEGLNITWQIEIKGVEEDEYTSYFEEEIVKPICAAEIQDNVVFSSFTASYLRKIKAIDNSLRTWYLSTILDDEAIEKAQKCQAEGIGFKGTVNYTSEENIKSALEQGFRLGVYTVDSPVIMGVYYQLGIRNFATNKISPMDVTKEMLTGTYNVKAFTCTLSKNDYKYDGSRKLPKVSVTYKGEELVEGVNYTLSYSDNKNPGTATVYVSGVNNCIDEQKLTFTISLNKVKGFEIASTTATTAKLLWTKAENVSGYIIYQYNYTKKKYEAIKTISNASKVTYKVKNLTPATKYRFRVKTYLTSEGKTYKSEACTKKTNYTKPETTKITLLQRYSSYKRLRIKWNAASGCTGYNVKIATDKKMENIVVHYNEKGSTKLKIKKLSKKKTYYVKVRAYLQVGKTAYYGGYSTVMKSTGKTTKKKSKK